MQQVYAYGVCHSMAAATPGGMHMQVFAACCTEFCSIYVPCIVLALLYKLLLVNATCGKRVVPPSAATSCRSVVAAPDPSTGTGVPLAGTMGYSRVRKGGQQLIQHAESHCSSRMVTHYSQFRISGAFYADHDDRYRVR